MGVIGFHLIFDLVIPANSQSFYLAKDFNTILFLFFAIPLSMIRKNESMMSFVESRFLRKISFNVLENLTILMKDLSSKLHFRDNAVNPVESPNDCMKSEDRLRF